MSFKFEKLIIWQDSMNFGESIFQMTLNFPKDEVYSLTSQIRRAADSIALNISEGSILQSTPEFKRFLGYSIRSIAEDLFQQNYQSAYKLMNQIIAFRNKLV